MKRICTAMQSYSLVILYINNEATWYLHLRAIKFCELYKNLGPGGITGPKEKK